MGKVNVYLPDDLEQSAREAGLAVSPICQTALRDALARLDEVRRHGRGAFTSRLDEVLDRARGVAGDAGRAVAPEDLFGAIVEHGENLGARALATMGIELPAPKVRRRAGDAGEMTAGAREVLAAALRLSLEMRHPRVGTEHVVIALAAPGSPLAPTLAAIGIEPRVLRRQVERLIANPWTTEVAAPAEDLVTIEQLNAAVQQLTAEVQRMKEQASRPTPPTS